MIRRAAGGREQRQLCLGNQDSKHDRPKIERERNIISYSKRGARGRVRTRTTSWCGKLVVHRLVYTRRVFF
jgi:hypothetical protein